MAEENANNHRKSFSGGHSTSICTKILVFIHNFLCFFIFIFIFLIQLKWFSDMQLLKRSTSANSELESSIEGAIAHCKQSQQLFSSRKSANESHGFCSLSASRMQFVGVKRSHQATSNDMRDTHMNMITLYD
ncbi:hypothetical protein GBA52_019501 [Prunus armeniaca]|nr:hypothetical protein GBA52_019501 [Prunus armeniaca]